MNLLRKLGTFKNAPNQVQFIFELEKLSKLQTLRCKVDDSVQKKHFRCHVNLQPVGSNRNF